jgi:hypothetical protein
MPADKKSQTNLGVLRSLERIATAEDLAEVLQATQSYLKAWPSERVVRLQRIAGGWAPFDQDRRPAPINGVRDLQRVQNAVHRQCVRLRQSGFALNPELLELDEVLFVAAETAESLESRESKVRSRAA